METKEEHILQSNCSKACTFMSASPFLQSSQVSLSHILSVTFQCPDLPLPFFIFYGAIMNSNNYNYISIFP